MIDIDKVCAFEYVYSLEICMNLIVYDIPMIWLVIEIVYQCVTDTVCIILMIDMYVMLCTHVCIIFFCIHRGRGCAGAGRGQRGWMMS